MRPTTKILRGCSFSTSSCTLGRQYSMASFFRLSNRQLRLRKNSAGTATESLNMLRRPSKRSVSLSAIWYGRWGGYRYSFVVGGRRTRFAAMSRSKSALSPPGFRLTINNSGCGLTGENCGLIPAGQDLRFLLQKSYESWFSPLIHDPRFPSSDGVFKTTGPGIMAP